MTTEVLHRERNDMSLALHMPPEERDKFFVPFARVTRAAQAELLTPKSSVQSCSPFAIELDPLLPRIFRFIGPPVVEVTGSSRHGGQLALVRKPKLLIHYAKEKLSESNGVKEKASPQGVHYDGYLSLHLAYILELRAALHTVHVTELNLPGSITGTQSIGHACDLWIADRAAAQHN